jgi:hypothetical protein
MAMEIITDISISNLDYIIFRHLTDDEQPILRKRL